MATSESSRRLDCRARATRVNHLLPVVASAIFLLTACPFGPSIPVEEEPPNMPPVISLDFIQPPPSGDFEEQVDRTEPTQIFQVTNFLDPNDAELLEVVWFRHDGTVSRLLTTESARRDTAQTGLHRGIFRFYTGSSYRLVPCNTEWRATNRASLTVLVADGPVDFVDFPSAEPIVAEGAFADTFTWNITFTGDCEQ